MPRPSPKPVDLSSDLPTHRLAMLRAELDQIDDSLHDLLMRRADLVTEVGALGAKGRVPLRPGREASIIRRLLGRNHGALAPSTIVRIWRELLAGSSAQQTPMTIAAADPALLPTAQEHFGALAHVVVRPAHQLLDEVRDGTVTVAVLPPPSEEQRWWLSLLDDEKAPVHVVARLPFWSRPIAREAVVLTSAEPDPSGADRTLIAGRLEGLDWALAAAGFVVGPVVAAAGTTLVDVDGFVAADDPRLSAFAGVVVLGAYAIPVGDSR